MEEELIQDQSQEPTPTTLEEIQAILKSSGDSVWVVNREIQKIVEGHPWNEEIESNILRNVTHLEWVASNKDVLRSGLDISNITSAIEAGRLELSKH